MLVCKGTTKQGASCRINFGLDSQGFCKYHAPGREPCKGIARSTGQRCRIQWDLNASGYCKHHASAAITRQCVAIARTTGQRCRVRSGIDALGFCSVHQQTQSSSSPLRPRCQGILYHTNQPCKNDAKPNYAYCCAAHDPTLVYYSPRLFDSAEKTRAFLEPQVVEYYDNRDVYHGDALDLTTPGFVELDHILEKQCFSYAFQCMAFEDRQEDVHYLASILRDEFVNEVVNLGLTRTPTNKIKGAAVWRYLDDAVTGHLPTAGASFTDYMLAEQRDGVRLGRGTKRAIVREMGRALRICQYKLADEGETPLLESLNAQLQQLYVDMELHVAASVVAKWDAEAKMSANDQDRTATTVGGSVSDTVAESHRVKTLVEAVSAPVFVPTSLRSERGGVALVPDDGENPPQPTKILAAVVDAVPFIPRTVAVHPGTSIGCQPGLTEAKPVSATTTERSDQELASREERDNKEPVTSSTLADEESLRVGMSPRVCSDEDQDAQASCTLVSTLKPSDSVPAQTQTPIS